MTAMQGKIVAVTTRPVGVEVGPSSTGTVVRVLDASPLNEGGGSLSFGDMGVPYVSADPIEETVTLESPLTVSAGDWLGVSPALTVTEATVRVNEDGDSVAARVPHQMKARLPDGVRDEPADAETVLLTWDGRGLVVSDVLGQGASQSWGDPFGRGLEVGDEGIVARDTIIADGFSSNGDIWIAGVPVAGTLLEGGTESGWLDRPAAGAVARQTFTSQTPARPSGEEWGYAALSATCRAGRLYRASTTAAVRPGVTGGGAIVRLRAAAAGSAGLSSTQVARGDIDAVTGPLATPRIYAQGFLEYAVDTDVDVLVTYQGNGGATPSMFSAEIAFEDCGPQGTYGGGSYRHIAPPATVDPTPPPPPTTPVVREYTSVWQATAGGTYRQDGSRRTDVDDLVAGYIAAGSAHGHQQSLVLFGPTAAQSGETSRTLNQALSGATVKKVEIWLHATHWYQSVGGTGRLGKWSSSNNNPSMPTTLSASPSLSVPVSSARWKKDQGRWVVIPNRWISDGTRGITLGGGTSRSSEYYGRFSGVHSSTPQARRPRIRVTYTR